MIRSYSISEKAAQVATHSSVIQAATQFAQSRIDQGVKPLTEEQKQASVLNNLPPQEAYTLQQQLDQLKTENDLLKARLESLTNSNLESQKTKPETSPASADPIQTPQEQINPQSPTPLQPINETTNGPQPIPNPSVVTNTESALNPIDQPFNTQLQNKLLSIEKKVKNTFEIAGMHNRDSQLLLAFQDYQSLKSQFAEELINPDSGLIARYNKLPEGEFKNTIRDQISAKIAIIKDLTAKQEALSQFEFKFSSQEYTQYQALKQAYTTKQDQYPTDSEGKNSLVKKSTGYINTEEAIKEIEKQFTAQQSREAAKTAQPQTKVVSKPEAPKIKTTPQTDETVLAEQNPATYPNLIIDGNSDQQLEINFNLSNDTSESPAPDITTSLDNNSEILIENVETPVGPLLPIPTSRPAPAKPVPKSNLTSEAPKPNIEGPKKRSNASRIIIDLAESIIGQTLIAKGGGGLTFNELTKKFETQNKDQKLLALIEEINTQLKSVNNNELFDDSQFKTIIKLINNYPKNQGSTEYGYNYTSFLMNEEENSITFEIKPTKANSTSTDEYPAKTITLDNLDVDKIQAIKDLINTDPKNNQIKYLLNKLLFVYVSKKDETTVQREALISTLNEVGTILSKSNYNIQNCILNDKGEIVISYTEQLSAVDKPTNENLILNPETIQLTGLNPGLLLAKIQQIDKTLKSNRPIKNVKLSYEYENDVLTQLDLEFTLKKTFYPKVTQKLRLNNTLVDPELFENIVNFDKTFRSLFTEEDMKSLIYRMIEKEAPELISHTYIPSDKSPFYQDSVERKTFMDEQLKIFDGIQLFSDGLDYISTPEFDMSNGTTPNNFTRQELQANNEKIREVYKQALQDPDLSSKVLEFAKLLKPSNIDPDGSKAKVMADSIKQYIAHNVIQELVISFKEKGFAEPFIDPESNIILDLQSMDRPNFIQDYILPIIKDQLVIRYPEYSSIYEFEDSSLAKLENTNITLNDKQQKFPDILNRLSSLAQKGLTSAQADFIKELLYKTESAARKDEYIDQLDNILSKLWKKNEDKLIELGIV